MLILIFKNSSFKFNLYTKYFFPINYICYIPYSTTFSPITNISFKQINYSYNTFYIYIYKTMNLIQNVKNIKIK